MRSLLLLIPAGAALLLVALYVSNLHSPSSPHGRPLGDRLVVALEFLSTAFVSELGVWAWPLPAVGLLALLVVTALVLLRVCQKQRPEMCGGAVEIQPLRTVFTISSRGPLSVAQHVDASEPLDGRRGERGHGVRVTQVHRQDVLVGGRGHVAAHHPGTLAAEHLDQRRADATRRARHDDAPAGEAGGTRTRTCFSSHEQKSTASLSARARRTC